MAIINVGGAGGGRQYIVPIEEGMLSSLPSNAFSNNIVIEKVYFPSCTTIGSYAFYSCSSLTEAYFPVCTTISNSAFQSATGSLYLGSYSKSNIYTIFGKVDSTSAQSYASYIQISGIEIPAMTIIGDYAFYYASKLQTVKAVNCTTIGIQAFQSCSSLTEAYFPACKTIATSAFKYATGSLYLGSYFNSSIYTIFGKTSTTASSVSTAYRTYIQISGIEIPEMTILGGYAFYYALNLQTVKAVNCTRICRDAFDGCFSLTEVSFPACTYIESYAFYNCSSLTEVSFPVCTGIGRNAFCDCHSLSEVSFPACTSISDYAFYACSSLMSAYFLSTSVCTLSSAGFNSTPMIYSSYTGSYGSIYVPSSLVNSYKTATNWTIYSNRITSYIEE